MIAALTLMARIAGVLGLAALAALHALWASGRPWPAKTADQLAQAVIGQPRAIPGVVPTALVAAGSAGASVLASGVLGRGRMQRLGVRVVGTALLLRAAVGGDVVLELAGMPPAGETFRRLDRRYYRPFAAVLGLALWLSARGMRRRPAPTRE